MRGLLVLFMLPGAAQAEGRVPAPDDFVAAVVETSTAQALAVNCRALSVDPVAMSRRSEATLALMAAEGFTPDNLAERMEDPSDRIVALQDAFVEKHALADGAPEAEVCEAGLREIAEGTGIGRLLLEVAE